MSMLNFFDSSSLQAPQSLITSLKEVETLCDKTLEQQEALPEIQQQNLDAVEGSKVAFKILLSAEYKEGSEMHRAFLELLTIVTYEVDKLATKQGFGTSSTCLPTLTLFDS
jgi:hypothetical protein